MMITKLPDENSSQEETLRRARRIIVLASEMNTKALHPCRSFGVAQDGAPVDCRIDKLCGVLNLLNQLFFVKPHPFGGTCFVMCRCLFSVCLLNNGT